MQVDPIKPTLKPPGSQRLILRCDELLSNVAFSFNVRPYTMVSATVCTFALYVPMLDAMGPQGNFGNINIKEWRRVFGSKFRTTSPAGIALPRRESTTSPGTTSPAGIVFTRQESTSPAGIVLARRDTTTSPARVAGIIPKEVAIPEATASHNPLYDE